MCVLFVTLHSCYNFALVLHENTLGFSQSEARNFSCTLLGFLKEYFLCQVVTSRSGNSGDGLGLPPKATPRIHTEYPGSEITMTSAGFEKLACQSQSIFFILTHLRSFVVYFCCFTLLLNNHFMVSGGLKKRATNIVA